MLFSPYKYKVIRFKFNFFQRRNMERSVFLSDKPRGFFTAIGRFETTMHYGTGTFVFAQATIRSHSYIRARFVVRR
jgi:transcription elongation factor GreA-like protein